ncbi:MAG: carboxypeptidase-like regulatory domain-containing protein [Longimicrobiales bacterium]
MSQSSRTGAIEGTVVSETGGPVEDARVLITGASPSHHDIAALTDARGRFRFDDLTPGHYGLRALSEADGQAEYGMEVRAGNVARLELVLMRRPG